MKIPRVLLAAPASGSGKTMITCGILQALVERGLRVSSFKCGPDYIDPMFHRQVIGTQSANLDLFFAPGGLTRYLFSRNAESTEIAVVEGVMGYYDGMSAGSVEGSSWQVAKTIDAPVVLIINARGQSVSALSTLSGFLRFKPDSGIRGVIFNQMSRGVYDALKPQVEAMGVLPLGYLPKSPELVVESRHLGLVAPEEVDDLKQRLKDLSARLEQTLDLDALIHLAEQAPPITAAPPTLPKPQRPVTIAVAKDEAFSFFYTDNLRLLEEMGATLRWFSPMRDKTLPEGTQGLLLCGGYPELYAKQLSENTAMRACISRAIADGMPCLAECGGFLYLHDTLEDADGNPWPMAGIIHARAYKTPKLGRFGYIQLAAAESCPYLPQGQTVRGHEFHYYESEDCGKTLTATKPVSGKGWVCAHGKDQLLAGFPHLFYYSNPELACRFLQACAKEAPWQNPL